MNTKNYRSELIGLLGYPVDENPTVVIMDAAFNELKLNYHYNTILVKPTDLEDAIKALKAFNMKGTHITIPHKVDVLKYLDFIAEDAKLMGSVNTICLKDGKTFGENTDGKGFIVSLNENNIVPAGKNAIILGAGGAARAIAVELAKEKLAHITIINRTKEKGELLAKLINGKTSTSAEFILWNETIEIPQTTDILINATSIGLYPDTKRPNINYTSLNEKIIVCDIIPNPPQTPFLKEAAKHGCKTLDGFSMLINQAAISFKLWTGQNAPINTMKKALATEFGIANASY